MKQKYTKARKATRVNMRLFGNHPLPVRERRALNILGADWREYNAKHPELNAVQEGK